MRFIGIAILSAIALPVISTRFAFADTIAADTQTEIEKQAPVQQNASLPTLLLALAFAPQGHFIPEQNREQAAYASVMEKWKKKQAELWSSLPKNAFAINASAYTAAADECGKSDGITASGIKVQEKRTLACPKNYPFGAKIEIEGMGIFTCEDRGGAIVGNHFDIYMETKQEAFAFGRRNLSAKVVE